MTCDEYQEQASQYVDGEMKDEDAGELFTHLGICVHCRIFLRGSLEVRSQIQDDILKTGATVLARPTTLTSILALPLIVLLGTIVLFLGILNLAPPPEAEVMDAMEVGGEQFQAPNPFWSRSIK